MYEIYFYCSNLDTMLSNKTFGCLLAMISAMQLVQTAAVPGDELMKSIQEVQKKFTGPKPIENDAIPGDIASNKASDAQSIAKDKNSDMMTEESTRRDKMLDYYGYYSGAGTPYQATYPSTYPQGYPAMYTAPYPVYLPSEEYDEDYNNNNIDDDEDAFSRANSRRKPVGGQNSPIFYIRLPPTPYMFVPGMGYISQPPTMQPIASPYALPPPPPPQPAVPAMSPFINLPINFVSNAKPTGIYQWNSGTNFGPQFPSYLPPRPRPSYQRPKPYVQHQDSKITHLKGPYMFNGRPEDVYLLPNPSFTSPYNAHYHHNPYAAPPPYTGYSPVYPPPLQTYY